MKDEQRVATERANHAACPVQVRETKPGNSGVGKAAKLSREVRVSFATLYSNLYCSGISRPS